MTIIQILDILKNTEASEGTVKYAFLVLVALFVLAASQEVSVPFDSAGKIQVVDEKLNKQLGLFPNISGFKQAQIFKVSDTLYSLELTRDESGKLIRERKTMTGSEYLRLTAKVDSILAVKPIASEIRAAKIKLLTGQAALIALSETACGLLGLGISYLTTDNWGVYTLGTALGAGLGFGLAYKAFEGKVKVDELGRLSVNVNPLSLTIVGIDKNSSKDKFIMPLIEIALE